jgi:UDPglucose--hexose-1-phosphate uridylyltransferase
MAASQAMPQMRVDPLTGRLVAVAPGRSARPGADAPRLEPVTDEELDACPFCEGREDQTPPEVLALPSEGRAPNTPGWSVRVVPNKYPAFERQEVVVHSPRHVRSLAELEGGHRSLIVAAWTSRAQAARQEGFAYQQVVVNEGRAAGASLPHSHSQLAWFREHPPVPASERTKAGACAVCELIRKELDSGTLGIAEADNAVVALCAPAGRVPYEILVAPIAHEPEPWGMPLEVGLDLAVLALRRLCAVEGQVPYNLWLHCAPFGGDGHWHLELVPRLTVFAGLELGAGIYVNTLAPEEAASRLRATHVE